MCMNAHDLHGDIMLFNKRDLSVKPIYLDKYTK